LHANGCPWDEKGLLFISAREGQEAVMQALIEAGADINKAYDDGVTPLLIAAHEGHVAMDEREGVTPLYIAAHKDHAAIVQILRDAGVA
jgi:cytohesin